MLRTAVLLLCFALAVNAQPTHPLSNIPPPGLITTGSFFPDHPVKHFPAGKSVKAVLGIHNEAGEDYNVTAIMGSLNSPTDFRLHVQNFTENIYHRALPAGGELSVEYTFMPDPRLEPRDFVVALTVFYHNNNGKPYASTFFNSTVEIVEVSKLIDWELIFLFVFLGGLAAGIVYVVYLFAAPQLASMGLISKKKRRKMENSTPDDADEWVKGSHYDNLKKKKAAAAAKRTN